VPVADEFYGLTTAAPTSRPQRGEGRAVATFDPAIGKFRLIGTKGVLEKVIPLRAADGTPFTRTVGPEANTGETIVDLNGNVLAPDPNGYDSEGRGRPRREFWVSDEYGLRHPLRPAQAARSTALAVQRDAAGRAGPSGCLTRAGGLPSPRTVARSSAHAVGAAADDLTRSRPTSPRCASSPTTCRTHAVHEYSTCSTIQDTIGAGQEITA